MQVSTQRLRNFWRDLHENPVWRYPELLPSDSRWAIDIRQSDKLASEYARVVWLWKKKPRSMIGSLSYFLLLLATTMILLIPHYGIWCALSLVGVMFTVAAMDTILYVRWRRDYEKSLDRLVHVLDTDE